MPTINRGKLLILFIFGTALAMAVFAWSFQYLRGKRVLQLYGANAARLIRVDAERVELLRLGVPGEAAGAELLKLDNKQVPVVQTIDITKARGLIHARQALIEDSSYEWNRPLGDCEPQWEYALRFSAGEASATTAFDLGCERLRLLETGAQAPLAEHFIRGMQTFVDEQQPPDEAR